MNASRHHRSRHAILRALSVLPLAAIAVATVAIDTATFATPAQATSTSPPLPSATAELNVLLLAERTRLEQAVEDATKRTGAEAAAGVSTAALDELAAAVASAALLAEGPLPFEGVGRAIFSPGTSDLSAVSAAAHDLAARLDEAVVAWEKELAAERARIEEARRKAAEEEARRRADEEAKRLAAARTPRPRPAALAAAPAAVAEGAEQRVRRLMAQSPAAGLGLQLAPCANPNAYACYYAGGSFVRVTPYGLRLSDCQLVRALAHEYRHYAQWNAGQWQIVNGDLANRDWAEADARAFASGYGCWYNGA